MLFGTKAIDPVAAASDMANPVFLAASMLVERVCTENLYPRIAVMESAEDGERFDASSSLDRARNRRIFVQ
jgi:hypothetical protein